MIDNQLFSIEFIAFLVKKKKKMHLFVLQAKVNRKERVEKKQIVLPCLMIDSKNDDDDNNDDNDENV